MDAHRQVLYHYNGFPVIYYDTIGKLQYHPHIPFAVARALAHPRITLSAIMMAIGYFVYHLLGLWC